MGTTNLAAAPVTLQQGSYGAIDLRRMVTTMLGEGIIAAGDFAVTQRAAGANMSVDVAAGQAYVKGDTASDQGHYFVRSAAAVNVPVTASDASNPRIVRVALEIKDDAHDLGGLNLGRIRTIDGVATAGATLSNLIGAPAVPDSCMLLANVLVPAGSTTVTTGNVQDRRTGVPIPGRQMLGGLASSVVSLTNSGDKLSATVVGNGVTPVSVRFNAWYASVSASPNNASLSIFDGAARTGTSYWEQLGHSPNAGAPMNPNFEAPVAAFSGAKTFYLNLQSTAGTPTIGASASIPATLRALWA